MWISDCFLMCLRNGVPVVIRTFLNMTLSISMNCTNPEFYHFALLYEINLVLPGTTRLLFNRSWAVGSPEKEREKMLALLNGLLELSPTLRSLQWLSSLSAVLPPSSPTTSTRRSSTSSRLLLF